MDGKWKLLEAAGRKASSVWSLYADGFRNLTWGKPLWYLIILKLVLLFAVLRVFFFQPVLSGMDDGQKSEHVGMQLSERWKTQE